MKPVLVLEGLSAGYGNVPVVRDLSLTLDAGEVVVIGGENGAGKSTLLRTVAGFIRPSVGVIRFNGLDVTDLGTEERVQRGLRLVLDGHRVFPDITIEDNLRLGYLNRGRSMRDLVEEVYVTYPILREKRRNWARDLSGGQQQMLALGQALMAQPMVVLCDEPSLGLAQSLMPQVMKSLKSLADAGSGVIVVEQTIELALPIADRVIMVERGSIRSEARKEQLDQVSSGRKAGRERLRTLGQAT